MLERGAVLTMPYIRTEETSIIYKVKVNEDKQLVVSVESELPDFDIDPLILNRNNTFVIAMNAIEGRAVELGGAVLERFLALDQAFRDANVKRD